MFKKKTMRNALTFLLALTPMLIENRISFWAVGEPQIPKQYKK